MAASKRKRKKAARNVMTTLILVLLAVSLVGYSAYRIVDLKLEQRQLVAQQAELEKQKEKLTAQLANVNDPEYIEQEARTQLKLIMPGETLYILQDEEDSDED